MSLVISCLIVLASLAAASGQGCYSEELGKYFSDGAEWTESGCTLVTCRRGLKTALPCGLVAVPPDSGCRLETPQAGLEYPDCCVRAVCPRPDQCYSKALDRVFDDGAEWSEPPCSRVVCSKGEMSAVPCPLQQVGAGCQLEDGAAGADYPQCCPQVVCSSGYGG